jgi:predicted PurR-regulated permease PerM
MSTNNPFRRPPSVTMVWLFIGALVVLVLVKVIHVVVLVFLAVLVGIYLSAITDALEYRLRWPRWAGLTVAVVGTTAALTGIGVLLFPPVINQTQDLVAGLPATLNDIQTVLARWAAQYPWLSNTQLADPTSGVLPAMVDNVGTFLRTQLVPYAWAGGELFIEIFAMVVMALYLARNPRLYRDGIVAVVTPRYRELAANVLEDAGSTLRAWVVGQLLAMVVLAILTAIGLLALNVKYWLTFGLFTGLVAVVPFFGTLVSTILPALFVVGSGDWVKVFLVLALGVVVHLVEANFVVPRIMQRQIALPPVLTIASVLLMGSLLGPIGLIVAVPVLALTLVLGRHILIGEIYGDVTREPMSVLRPVDELPRVDTSLAEERPVSPRAATGGTAAQLP